MVYTYDRLPFFFPDLTTGAKTTTMATRTHRRNFMIANYGCSWPIDHDDGSLRYRDTENVLMYGGSKSYLGGHTMLTSSSLFLWPDSNGWGSAGMLYANVANHSGFDEHWTNNTVVFTPGARGHQAGPRLFDLGSCTAATLQQKSLGADMWLQSSHNTLYSEEAPVVKCGNEAAPFSKWTAAGQDGGTVVSAVLPSDDALAQMARRLLAQASTS